MRLCPSVVWKPGMSLGKGSGGIPLLSAVSGVLSLGIGWLHGQEHLASVLLGASFGTSAPGVVVVAIGMITVIPFDVAQDRAEHIGVYLGQTFLGLPEIRPRCLPGETGHPHEGFSGEQRTGTL